MAIVAYNFFENISTFFSFIEGTLGNHLFLLTITSVACLLKAYIVGLIIFSRQEVRGEKYLRILLLVTLTGFIVTDIAWIAQLVQLIWFPDQVILLARIIVRVAWAMTVFQYLAFALFVESLVVKDRLIRKRHIPLIVMSGLFFGFFVYSFFNFNGISRQTFLWILNMLHIYLHFPLVIPSIVFALWKLTYSHIPALLKKQATICLKYFIIPQVIIDFLEFYPYYIAEKNSSDTSFAFVSLSTMFLIAAFCFCARKIMGLRFLNAAKHVRSPTRIAFVDKMKATLEQLSQSTNIQDVQYATDSFFSQMFDLPLGITKLHVRVWGDTKETIMAKVHATTPTIERAVVEATSGFNEFVRTNKILIYQELEFSNFYDENAYRSQVLEFLDRIQATVFIPIYKNDQILAAITVDRFIRPGNPFYSDVEADEMLIFVQYVSNVIHLIQHRSFDQMVENEQVLQDELYQRREQLSHYKESLNTILRASRGQEVGVMFYRSRRFLIGNRNAHNLLGFDPGIHSKHPIAKQLRQMAEQVMAQDVAQSGFYFDERKNKIVVHATPSISQSHIIITLSYADASDFIRDQIVKLPDPHEWDYLLYLETTRSGQLINQLVPGTTKELLMFKIELLRASFGKRPLLLEMAQADLVPAVEIIHQIAMRDKLHVLQLKEPTQPETMVPKLFGINPLLMSSDQQQNALLAQLSGADTLFIQNINFLDPTSQEHLVELVKYGSYRQYKSQHKKENSVRIIASSSEPLDQVVARGGFNQALYNELQKTSLRMPSLTMLTPSSMQELALDISAQVKGASYGKQALSAADLAQLNDNRSGSLKDLKLRVERLVKQNAELSKRVVETVYSPDRVLSDNDLNSIPRGRQALKNRQIMTFLWRKFKNQNEIAQFLGVNRSSVNRRCKMYGLE